jgi:glutarate dioxygenase
MSIAEKKKVKFERVTEMYEVKVHPQSNRLYHIQISKGTLSSFREWQSRSINCPESRVYAICTPYRRILFIRSGWGRIW